MGFSVGGLEGGFVGDVVILALVENDVAPGDNTDIGGDVFGVGIVGRGVLDIDCDGGGVLGFKV